MHFTSDGLCLTANRGIHHHPPQNCPLRDVNHLNSAPCSAAGVPLIKALDRPAPFRFQQGPSAARHPTPDQPPCNTAGPSGESLRQIPRLAAGFRRFPAESGDARGRLTATFKNGRLLSAPSPRSFRAYSRLIITTRDLHFLH